MKKFLTAILSVMLVLLSAAVYAENYVPGVTVAANPDSPTGYTVTIVYEAPGAEKVELAGSFAFYYDDPEIRGKTPETYYTPAEYAEGMFAIGQESHREAMSKVEGTDYFVTTYNLPSGHYQYCFYVDEDTVRKDDPTNPGQYDTVENGGKYTRSVFDVPYDAKQGSAQDYAYAAKNTDQPGTITYVNYDAIDGGKGAAGIYTPYGYDAGREQPYKVLYLANGTGGDETFWYGGGAAANVFDNLIEKGEVEPTIIVCMDAERYTITEPSFEWDYDTEVEDIVKAIIPFVEANYNVDRTPEGRAFAGLSRGAFLGAHMLAAYPEEFQYFGMFSGGDASLDLKEKLDVVKTRKIMMGAGCYDILFKDNVFSYETYADYLTSLGVDFASYEVQGAHEWFTWIQLLHSFGLSHLWK